MAFFQPNSAPERRRPIKSASKFMSLDDLCEIQENYYRHPVTGQEYYDYTVDDLIIEKEQKIADERMRIIHREGMIAYERETLEESEVEHVMAKTKKPSSKVVDIGVKRSERAGLTCRACKKQVPNEAAWEVGEGTNSGIHVCPECRELQATTILSATVTATDENLILLIPKSLILDLNDQYDPESKLDFGAILANTLRSYIVDLLKGDASCFYRE